MNEELEKIDIIRERIGISYREAKEVLSTAGGDLVEALIIAEVKLNERWSARVMDKGDELVNDFKTYVAKGNKTKVKIKNGDKTVAEFPATIGVIGVLAALASPPLAVATGIGAVAAIANNIHLEIEKAETEAKTAGLEQDEGD